MADHEQNEVVEILILINISSQQNPINMRTLKKKHKKATIIKIVKLRKICIIISPMKQYYDI
jgi:hypothetical protein